MTPDGLLGALSQPASAGHLETETADDFILTETTSIAQATITGLIPSGTPLANISNVEVEVYHVFPKDSADPPSGNVPARTNSPADVEIDTATRDGSLGTLAFSASLLDESFSVLNTVVDGINQAPDNMTNGEGPASGEVVQITITFTPPIVLPADHYFFRPEVAGGRRRFPVPVGTEADRGARDAVHGRLASLDPQLGLEAGLAANRYRHHRRHPRADVQYGVFPDRRDRSSGRNSYGDRNARTPNGNPHSPTEQQRWRRLQYRCCPVGKPPNPLAPAGAGRGVVVDAPAARVKDAA